MLAEGTIIIFEQLESGEYFGKLEDKPNVFSTGKDLTELVQNLAEVEKLLQE